VTASLCLGPALPGTLEAWTPGGQATATEGTRGAPEARRDGVGARPLVRLIATGGTISDRRGGRLTADELLDSVPNLDRYAEARAEQFVNLSSGDLTLEQWLELSRRINHLFSSEPGLAGIVVTSGTDTLEEVAYFLHLTVRSDRPVVVVGSMRNPDTLGYEGAANLLEAFRVAADPMARRRGVLVVLNDKIHSARDVTKSDAVHLETFRSPYGVLGVVDADRVVFYRDLLPRHTARSEFDVVNIPALPRVDVVMVYQGASGDLIRASVDNGAKGVVIAGAGAGSTSGTQAEAIEYALERGVFVVIGTRTGAGRVVSSGLQGGKDDGRRDGDPERARRGARIHAEDIAPVKARILLMLALTATHSGSVIQRMFGDY
jgi:L-asparaginase